MERREIHHRIAFYLCLLIAGLMPLFPVILPLLIGLLTINALVARNVKARFDLLSQSLPNILLIAFYLLNVLGLLWSDNMPSAWMHLEIKLSVGLLPLVLYADPTLTGADLRRIRTAFTAGCLVSAVVCLSVASAHYFRTGENHFTYNDLSGTFHPTYLSMYYLLSMAFLWKDFLAGHAARTVWPAIAAIMLLAVSVLLLSSKINLFLLFLGGIATGIFLICRKSSSRLVVSSVAAFLGLSLILVILNPSIRGRVEKALDIVSSPESIHKEDTESNAARMLVWKAGWTLLKKHPFSGTGTGDVNDELVRTYGELNFSGVFEKKLNAHNQFLQTAIAIGIFGGLLLLTVFIAAIREGLREQHSLSVIFYLVLFFNFLVEGILETQAGVLFFSFFSAILLTKKTA